MNQSVDKDNNDNGHPDFLVRGIGPIKTLKGKRGYLDMKVCKYVEVQSVQILKDGQQDAKIKFIDLSNDMLYQAYKTGLPTAGLAGVLGSMVEGKGLYFDSIGEFFQFFDRFEQMLDLADSYNQRKIGHEMKARLGNDLDRLFREYFRDGSKSLMPLPLYVRNALAHQGTNPVNSLHVWRSDN